MFYFMRSAIGIMKIRTHDLWLRSLVFYPSDIPSVKYLETLETLGKNFAKILTKSAKNMYHLARPCQELQERCLIFSTESGNRTQYLMVPSVRLNDAAIPP